MNTTLVGSQFGDEGKGRMTDVFSENADVVVRFQGGDNAGHTIETDGEEYSLRLVPSGVVRGKTGVLGNGCVVNVGTLFDELDRLQERGLDPELYVSGRATVVLPYHRVLDEAAEQSREETATAVGTTGNGIGPAYEDAAGRRAIRVAELLDPGTLRERLDHVVPRKRALAESVYGVEAGEAFDVEALFEQFRAYGRRLDRDGMVVDAGTFLADHDGDIVFESAQGTQLDLDHGSYPFVTSSNPTAGGAVVGTGVPPEIVTNGETVGVVKAYLSRVGAGPMPTEFEGERATTLREAAGEFGTVTGRPRRVGWLDLPMLRHATRLNGYTGITLGHLDALATLDDLRVCTAYELDGERIETPPPSADQWERCVPEYERFDSWADREWQTVADRGYEALPEAAKAYTEFVSDDLGVPVYAVGVGPGREATIVRENPVIQGDTTPTPDR